MRRAVRIFDPVLFGLALFATLVGLFFIFDAGYARSLVSGKGTLPPELLSQLKLLLFALGAGWAASFLNAKQLRALAIPVWVLNVILLIVVHFHGETQNGGMRWLKLGPIMIQPAEFTKLAAILYLAAVFADRPKWPAKLPQISDPVKRFETISWPKLKRSFPALFVLAAVVLINFEPDLGTAAVVASIAFAMFIPGGVSGRSLTLMIALTVIGVTGLVISHPFRVERILNHSSRWDPKNVDENGFQTNQSEVAQANGGWKGVGIGNGRAKHVIPATTTDFIMATVGEETGLWGALLMLGLQATVTFRVFYLAGQSKDRFITLVLFGVGVWFGVQACVNVMMANGFLPAIGIPLPFISSGGSSLVALWMAIGVCQAVLAPIPEPKEKKKRKATKAVAKSRAVRA